MTTNTYESHLAAVQSLLQPDEIITKDSAYYQQSIKTWAYQKQQIPPIVVRPTSVESLSMVVAYLYSTDLDLAIYGQGFMSASAKDALINMSGFDMFHFDKQSETITIGAGQAWVDVYRKLGKVAPEYGVVGSRTPNVGIAGTIITGGFSWISTEYGCISDPANMLDVKVVKYDGSIVWASTEPDLLWACRGGGGGFGVIAEVVLRVFKYPQDIWAGSILIPRSELPRVADGIVQFLSSPSDPKVTMMVYVVKKKLLESFGVDTDMVVIHAFDACGEDHGRASFKWALDIPGAIDQTMITNLQGVSALQDKVHIVKGTLKQYWAPILLRDITKEILLNAINWNEEIHRTDSSVGDCTYLIFEFLCSRDPVGASTSSCAWPRPSGAQHILLYGPGCPSNAVEETEEFVRDVAIEAPSKIVGDTQDVHIIPNCLEDFHDPKETWGPHYNRLQGLRRVYDPRNKLKGAISA